MVKAQHDAGCPESRYALSDWSDAIVSPGTAKDEFPLASPAHVRALPPTISPGPRSFQRCELAADILQNGSALTTRKPGIKKAVPAEESE
jgi:hypothetical protein